MSNFFTDIEKDGDKIEEDILGPNYEYYKYIKTPEEMGMSSEGSLGALVRDAGGLINYVELLVSGTGAGSKTGRPLGNQYFLRTGAECTDTETGDIHTRYIYINHIPTGTIPFISSGLGMDFPMLKGLIPSVLQNMEQMDPITLFKGFLAGEAPKCQKLTMPTTPSSMNQNRSRQTEYVTVSDIREMDPCIFSLNDYVNPVTGERCREAFSTMNGAAYHSPERDPVLQLYLWIVSLLGLYIFYRFLMKKK